MSANGPSTQRNYVDVSMIFKKLICHLLPSLLGPVLHASHQTDHSAKICKMGRTHRVPDMPPCVYTQVVCVLCAELVGVTQSKCKTLGITWQSKALQEYKKHRMQRKQDKQWMNLRWHKLSPGCSESRGNSSDLCQCFWLITCQMLAMILTRNISESELFLIIVSAVKQHLQAEVHLLLCILSGRPVSSSVFSALLLFYFIFIVNFLKWTLKKKNKLVSTKLYRTKFKVLVEIA